MFSSGTKVLYISLLVRRQRGSQEIRCLSKYMLKAKAPSPPFLYAPKGTSCLQYMSRAMQATGLAFPLFRGKANGNNHLLLLLLLLRLRLRLRLRRLRLGEKMRRKVKVREKRRDSPNNSKNKTTA